MTTSGPSSSPAHWLAFASWGLVGAGYAFGVLGLATIGMFVLAGSVVLTLLVLKAWGRRGLAGLVSGAGLPLLYVAFLNRGGPGMVCTTGPDSMSCVDAWSPWPWLAVGAALIAAGIVLESRRPAAG
ncbi:MAG: hypothetical protein L0H79_03850 [Intrasporangium sp.]|uniref:hypothetical protein n=1 Tax=Intrasporangium sp. TaxID=1925024 RepID=UPI002648BCEA|nr:hypothetical protein [Intrasporangium sp.]MDN5794868.1 hypothetical protein [Intrasporangium sp.]